MTKTQLTIATRESPLALWQANWVKAKLLSLYPSLTIHLLGLTTQADRLPYVSLAEVGGKGLFVKELEEALLDGRADLAVHSLKDMPAVMPPKLCLAAICERETPSDVLISTKYGRLVDVPAGEVIGTSSLRRQSQLLALRPDLQIKPLRGNVNTRLAKLDQGEYAGIILAAAGLQRLGLTDRIREYLTVDDFLPAAGQAALGLECREDDLVTQQLLMQLNHDSTALCVHAERAVCQRLGVGCHVPVAVLGVLDQDEIYLRGLVATTDGKRTLRAEVKVPKHLGIEAGIKVADDLLAQGADEILRSLDR